MSRPFVSGFCNPTLPRTARYDPHQRCPGCTCRAPGCPCNPEEPTVDEHVVIKTQTGEVIKHYPDTALDDAGLATMAEVTRAAAARLLDTTGAKHLTALDVEATVRIADTLRHALRDIRLIQDALTRHAYLIAEHGRPYIIDGVGSVTINRTRDRKRWDERGVAQAIIDARMQNTDGEAPAPWDVVEWLLEVIAVNYCRVTPLRALGIEPKAFCDDVPGKPNIDLPPLT